MKSFCFDFAQFKPEITGNVHSRKKKKNKTLFKWSDFQWVLRDQLKTFLSVAQVSGHLIHTTAGAP